MITRYWEILRDQKRPVKFLVSRVLMKTGVSSLMEIRRNDFVMGFHPTSISASLWIDPAHQDNQLHGGAEEQFLRRYLRDGDTMVDVGANIGLTTLVASVAVGSAGRVIAVEAHPRIFFYLYHNVRRNRSANVRLHNVALGDHEGVVFFSDYQSDDYNAVVRENSRLRVPLRRLDDVLAGRGSIALLKIDVEGFEKVVLEGARQTLDRTDCVYFESAADHYARYGYTCADVYGLLKRHGFGVYRIDGEALRPLPEGYQSLGHENLVAIRDLALFRQRTGLRPGKTL